jgi:hypothetical protein
LVVAKQPQSHYLIPALGLLGVNLVLMFDVLRQKLRAGNVRLVRFLFIGFFCVVLIAQAKAFSGLRKELTSVALNDRLAHEKVEIDFRDAFVVEYYSASSHAFALKVGSEQSGDLFASVLGRIYPEKVFYNLWTGEFSRFDGPVDLDRILPPGHSFLMHGSDLGDPNFLTFLPARFLPESIELETAYRGYADVPDVPAEVIYRAKLRE